MGFEACFASRLPSGRLEQFPLGKGRRLPNAGKRGIVQVPDSGLADQEALSRGCDPDPLVVVHEPLLRGSVKQAGTFIAVQWFGREPRWSLPQLIDRDMPEFECGPVSVVQDWISLGAMRDDDKRGFKKSLRLFFVTSVAGEQFMTHPVPIRVEQDPGVFNPAMQQPRLGRNDEGG